MALDKYLDTNGDISEDNTTKILSQNYIEYGLMRLFMVDIGNMIKTQAAISKQFHISPTEFNTMPYWEYEYWLLALNDLVKEENDNQEKEMGNYDVKGAMDRVNNPAKYQPKIPEMKMPSMPNFKI